MDGSHHFGLDSAQVGGEKIGPGLCCFNICAGLGNRAIFLFWAGPESIFGLKSVKEFSI
jgi:hypothetical protein